jgi:hypothetical protein
MRNGERAKRKNSPAPCPGYGFELDLVCFDPTSVLFFIVAITKARVDILKNCIVIF